uniref:Uncharacterized protein n=1 Tax=Ditylenchus dipsaci TaxID=166011 RepID=A0A915ETM3_9BILA
MRLKRHGILKAGFLTGKAAATPIKSLLAGLWSKILKLFGAQSGRELIVKVAAFIALDSAADTAVDIIMPDVPPDVPL